VLTFADKGVGDNQCNVDMSKTTCPTGCTCGRHARKARKKCEPGCTCGRHATGPKPAISKAKAGRALSDQHKAALKCQPGCTYKKHGLRNTGQFKAGSAGFTGPHTDEAKAKLASYIGERASSYKHGWANTPTYWSWNAMRSRCYDSRNASYPRYGGRGIAVCERWHDFENFLADMGPRPSREYSIDRIDGDGNYEPSNCRWATRARQNANRRDPGGWEARRKRMRSGP
jgi:hypothetical protein